MFENLLKYNQEEMNSLWKADPVDDFLENSIFKWNFDDGEDLFETSFHTEQEVTHSPPSLEKRNAKFRIGNPSKNTLPGRELLQIVWHKFGLMFYYNFPLLEVFLPFFFFLLVLFVIGKTLMVVKEETEMEMEELLSEEEIPDYQKSRKIPIIIITKF
jgi:hypothetical protein